MKTGVVIGAMVLVGAGAAALYFATRPKKRVVAPSSMPEQKQPWSFQIPQLSSSYTSQSSGTTPQQVSSQAEKPVAVPPIAMNPNFYGGIDSIMQKFGAPDKPLGPTTQNTYVMADRRNPPSKPSAPEPTSFIDSIIKSLEPKPAISLLRPENRSPAQVSLNTTPSFIDSILQSFAPSTARPSTSILRPSTSIPERRIAYPTTPTARPTVTPQGDDSPLAVIEQIVRAVVEPVARIAEPLEEPRVISSSLEPSPLSKFERDVGFVSAFTTSDGKRWLKDFRGAQYDSAEFHRSASAVADAAARSKREGKSYSPG